MKFMKFFDKIKDIQPDYIVCVEETFEGFNVVWRKKTDVVAFKFNRNPTDEIIEQYRQRLNKKWKSKKSSK